MLRNIKPLCVFFDIGSTLICGPSASPTKTIVAALGDAYDPVAMPICDLENDLFTLDIRTVYGLATILTGYGVPYDVALRSAQDVWCTQIVGPEIIPGGVELLKALRRAAIPYGFISNIWHPYAQSFERLYGKLATHAEGPVIYSYRQGIRKPNKDLFRIALHVSEYSSVPEQCVVVGDTYFADIVTAIDLGMKTIHVRRRPEKEAWAIDGYTRKNLDAPDNLVAPDKWVDSIADISIEMLRELVPYAKLVPPYCI